MPNKLGRWHRPKSAQLSIVRKLGVFKVLGSFLKPSDKSQSANPVLIHGKVEGFEEQLEFSLTSEEPKANGYLALFKKCGIRLKARKLQAANAIVLRCNFEEKPRDLDGCSIKKASLVNTSTRDKIGFKISNVEQKHGRAWWTDEFEIDSRNLPQTLELNITFGVRSGKPDEVAFQLTLAPVRPRENKQASPDIGAEQTHSPAMQQPDFLPNQPPHISTPRTRGAVIKNANPQPVQPESAQMTENSTRAAFDKIAGDLNGLRENARNMGVEVQEISRFVEDIKTKKPITAINERIDTIEKVLHSLSDEVRALAGQLRSAQSKPDDFAEAVKAWYEHERQQSRENAKKFLPANHWLTKVRAMFTAIEECLSRRSDIDPLPNTIRSEIASLKVKLKQDMEMFESRVFQGVEQEPPLAFQQYVQYRFVQERIESGTAVDEAAAFRQYILNYYLAARDQLLGLQPATTDRDDWNFVDETILKGSLAHHLRSLWTISGGSLAADGTAVEQYLNDILDPLGLELYPASERTFMPDKHAREDGGLGTLIDSVVAPGLIKKDNQVVLLPALVRTR